jgi:DNA-binding beta-propeller fold protein YncE
MDCDFSNSGISCCIEAAARCMVMSVVVAVMVGCQAPAFGPDATARERDQLLWPSPPEQPRFAYEFTLRSPADVADTEQEKLRRAVTGERPSDAPAFAKPAAVAAQRGRIYVTDTVNRVVVVFDVPRRRVFRFGLRAPATLRKPIGLALDDSGRVFVADATRREVLVYDGLGLFLRAIGGGGQLTRPTGVAVTRAGDRIYVVDRGENESDRHRVIAFDATGAKLFEIGHRGSGAGEFNIPVQAVVGPDDTLYVLDAGNFRVQAFAPDGTFVRAFGKPGTELGALARPRGLAVDAESNVYVTDASFGNFQIYTSDGALLLAIGRPGRIDRPGRFGLVSGIAVDETARVYVVDQLFTKVEVYQRLSDAEGRALLRREAQR